MEDAVESLSYMTRDWVDNHSNVWSDTASLTYLADKDDSVTSYAKDTYSGLSLADFAAPIEVHAVGASIAFLVDAGQEVPADVPLDTSTQCGPGKTFYHGQGCQTTKSSIWQPPGTDVAITAGGACDPESGVCPAGMECVTAGPNANTCEVHGTIGTKCGSTTDCKNGLVCADSGPEAGTCVERNGTGEPCSSNNDCSNGLACAKVGPKAGTCEPSGTGGTPCSSNTDCLSGSVCAVAGLNSGTCQPKGGPGTSCNWDGGCTGGLVRAVAGSYIHVLLSKVVAARR